MMSCRHRLNGSVSSDIETYRAVVLRDTQGKSPLPLCFSRINENAVKVKEECMKIIIFVALAVAIYAVLRPLVRKITGK